MVLGVHILFHIVGLLVKRVLQLFLLFSIAMEYYMRLFFFQSLSEDTFSTDS